MLTVFVVIRETGSNACWECSGGGSQDVVLVVAESGMQACELAAKRYKLDTWEPAREYRAIPVRPSKHKKPRVLPHSHWDITAPAWCPPSQHGGR